MSNSSSKTKIRVISSFFLSSNLTSIPRPERSIWDNYIVDLSKTLLLFRQETKYKAIAFWLAEHINSISKLHGVNCFPSCWPTCNECHGELGTLATGGLHPQQHLGNIGDKPYLSSAHSQALHACHTLPLNDGLNIWTLTKIAWAEHFWSLANNSDVHMSTQILLYSSCSSASM